MSHSGKVPQELHIVLSRLPGRGMRISTPVARGWATVAKSPEELYRAVVSAFSEAQIASYAEKRNECYDLDAVTMEDASDPSTKSTSRAQWVRMPDGKWRSPGGRFYPPSNPVVKRMLDKPDSPLNMVPKPHPDAEGSTFGS